jgi:DNA-binding PadR family transcriptional regulator
LKPARCIPRCTASKAKAWIAASWELSDKGKRARYYRITPKGRKQLAAEQSKWDAFARAMGLLLKPAAEDAP